VIATPNGLGFIDQEAIEAQTGYPIRSAWRTPSIPQPLRPADAIAVAPATFNTINKWAAGISDTLALGILCEAYGLGIPVAVQPYVNSAQAPHPAYAESLARLQSIGVLMGNYVPHEPKSGAAGRLQLDPRPRSAPPRGGLSGREGVTIAPGYGRKARYCCRDREYVP
jgi:phosphopantothenoylcysteine synthetase/decarboxylase